MNNKDTLHRGDIIVTTWEYINSVQYGMGVALDIVSGYEERRYVRWNGIGGISGENIDCSSSIKIISTIFRDSV